jgi:hypothetical protein
MSGSRRTVYGMTSEVVGRWTPGARYNRMTCPVNHGAHVQRADLADLASISETLQLGVLVQSSGLKVYRLWCPLCRNSFGPLPNALVAQWTDRPVTWELDDVAGHHRCTYEGCTAHGAELHHIAPRNTFRDSESWPQVYLCRDHHRQWHQRMSGYRWSAPAAQSSR